MEKLMITGKDTGEFHPGELLGDEIFSRHITQLQFAKQLGVQKTVLNEIIKGRRNISAVLALKLEAAFGIEAECWLKAQMSYDLRRLREVEKRYPESR
jgi:HTH-type transcriptional regulator/antitoxin HigA